MTNFPIHSIETAPGASRPALEALNSAFGFIPNIAGTMATSPVLIGSLTDLFARVHGGSFSEAEIQILLLTNAVTNKAEWAVAFHSYLAIAEGVGAESVTSIREGALPVDARHAALAKLTRTLIERRGGLSEVEKREFLDADFDESRLLEVVAVLSASTITKYTSNITQPPLETPFQPHVWQTGRG
ncbi:MULTISPECIES: carboxymuconolactone decarboxylase family protein [unclassified Mesorhizobium]|uniref:carboxymuconolactone decarboxylase family protein n=1 Tax=unclassified Mesorhizobium TaxID=325217 RepID=UPI0003CF7005|nr:MULTISPECIES: carboxymuconolactone decarboxylase family protein [unclassified Mesorhizobium]ESW94986.1 carboxymuconolactone decarboxylase [Mesorhizobium sp. LSJC265A00]ESX97258.1 carboxymuconolactone decarboxylase [Mesorhizobium sp. LNJC403B00]ESX97757.1 carboxymuconolactone decarboxylase [Mesorhizobium sp. LNJC399B00]ESY12575.1 carboxymuconolactone decarboxylase [Mesorhizobium sp. LNJC394B00]ESY28268.1 carboxymuconolactone decarboxylase [Mesorhizobium sp. LNJC384A00]